MAVRKRNQAIAGLALTIAASIGAPMRNLS
jgi:hypothetical protein